MTRRSILFMALALFIANTSFALAHEQYRIIGTIAKVSPKELEIKQDKDGKVIGMDMTDTTLVTREGKKIAAAAACSILMSSPSAARTGRPAQPSRHCAQDTSARPTCLLTLRQV
jgi:hypothetical protein